MQIALNNIVPISQARARLTELADEVATDGRPKLFTRNGTGYVALISASELSRIEEGLSLAHATLREYVDSHFNILYAVTPTRGFLITLRNQKQAGY